MSVSTERKELTEIKDTYEMIADCVAGQKAVKDAGETYLPKPNASDVSLQNAVRYELYKQRAVFYNVTGRTLKGLVGEVYSVTPDVELPDAIAGIEQNVNGSGVSIIQQSKSATEKTLAFGRCGLFTDYPYMGAGASVKQIKDGRIMPTIRLYDPRDIIKWSTRKRGSEEILELVVLKETEEVLVDFDIEYHEKYRVLRLGKSAKNDFDGMIDNPDVFTVEVWSSDGGNGIIESSFQPRDRSGKYFDTINFDFIGSLNNDSVIDKPPMEDMSYLNISHYINSAEYEDSCFNSGQPTPVLIGIRKDWWEEVLNETITLGSVGGIPLHEGADAKFLQPEPNVMAKEAMEHKERQMASLGAAIVEQRAVQRTATEASIETTAEKSILATVVDNVSSAYQSALKRAYRFMGSDDAEIVFRLNNNFKISRMSLSDMTGIISGWQQGIYSWGEVRRHAELSGLELDEDEVAFVEIEKEQNARDDREAKKQQRIGGAGQ